MTEQTETKKDTVTVTVDGKTFEAAPGELVIAAAERHGIYIPRFCWHPRMKPVGMCRMCLVEIEGVRGLPPACTTPVAEGMVVDTRTPVVKKAQDGVLEFLLINHPLDCPVCDRGGECPLQDQTFSFGPGESRFVEEKRHFEKPIAISELVALDRERCIQCARCTRFADEVAGDPLISFVDRGDHTQVLTFPDDPFTSYFSGNTVQICPVGALTASPYRFKARPWDLDQVESTCSTCAVGCRVNLQSSQNDLVRMLGVDSEPVNHSWLCDKGRFGYQAVEHDGRVTHPLVRKGDELIEASWSEAYAAAAKGLADVRDLHGAGAIAFLGGARGTNEDAYAWAKLAKGVLATDSVDCQLDDGLPAAAVLGLPRATIDDACRAKAVLLLGPDLKEELPVLYLRLREAVVDGGVAVVELGPQSTGMTRHAKTTLLYRPGEAVEVARALTSGRDPMPDAGGVRGEELAAAAGILGRAGEGVVVVLGRPSVAESGRTVAEAAAVIAAAWPQARFLPALRRGNVMGALDMGLAPGVLPGRVGLDAGREWFSQEWGVLPEEPGLDAAGIVGAAAEGRVQALVLLGADPINDFPDRTLARRALAGAGFVVAVDTFLTDSSREADVVLPAAMYGEKAGTTTNIEGRVTRVNQKVTAPGTVRSDWIIAAELAQRLGGDLGFDSTAAVWAEIARLAPSHVGLTADVLGRRENRDGVVAPYEGEGPPRHEAPVEQIEAAAAVHQGETLPSEAVAGAPEHAAVDEPSDDDDPAGAGRPPLLTFAVGDAGSTAAPPAVDAYALRLVAGRRLYDNGVTVRHSAHLAGLAPSPRLRANPYDLDRLGLGTGDRVRVTSSRTTLTLEVAADTGIPRGSVALPFNLPGEGAADLIDGTQPVTDLRVETTN
ncbi:MAG: NADH-quinone oxidoreductase, chain [Acidimicrobiales bacterium]|jgi:NADH-quinone oxidoreductase subunit G|nr:NADH-quinone oxidoreductase, chain [Acidimicrobiales bacterium]